MKAHAAALILIATCGSLPSSAQEARRPVHWGYSGEAGPERWAGLEPANATCTTGRSQSPIDLTGFTQADLPEIRFNYQAGGHEVVNNGHAIQVNYLPGSSISLDGTVFELKQFHFHAPSEHRVDGKSFPMEAHFVHADASGALAVVAVLFEPGQHNDMLDGIWRRVMPLVDGRAAVKPVADANRLMGDDRDYLRYDGSLTTPPCTEGVRWIVLKRRAQASEEQLAVVTKILGHPNNRPLQAIGARAVLD